MICQSELFYREYAHMSSTISSCRFNEFIYAERNDFTDDNKSEFIIPDQESI